MKSPGSGTITNRSQTPDTKRKKKRQKVTQAEGEIGIP